MKSHSFLRYSLVSMMLAGMISGTAFAADSTHMTGGFKNIGSIDELMNLPTAELCSDGGPTMGEINLILLNGPLTVSMYTNDPTTARLVIREQANKIKANIAKQCTASASDTHPHRWNSIKMLRSMSESEVCAGGAPTKTELLALLSSDEETNAGFDETMENLPPHARIVMEEGAKMQGTSMRKIMLDDIATAAAKNWEIGCSKQSKTTSDELTTNNTDSISNIKSDIQLKFDESDKRLNDIWKSLSADMRKKLLPEQQKWIKNKDAVCKTDIKCFTDMTNERILEIEPQR